MWKAELQTGKTIPTLRTNLKPIPRAEPSLDCCQKAIIEIDKRLKDLHKKYDNFEATTVDESWGMKAIYMYDIPGGGITSKPVGFSNTRPNWDKSIQLSYKSNYDINNKRLMCSLLNSITHDYRPDYFGTTRFGINLHAGYGNASLVFSYHGPKKESVIEILDSIKRFAVKKKKECEEDIQYFEDNKFKSPGGINVINLMWKAELRTKTIPTLRTNLKPIPRKKRPETNEDCKEWLRKLIELFKKFEVFPKITMDAKMENNMSEKTACHVKDYIINSINNQGWKTFMTHLGHTQATKISIDIEVGKDRKEEMTHKIGESYYPFFTKIVCDIYLNVDYIDIFDKLLQSLTSAVWLRFGKDKPPEGEGITILGKILSDIDKHINEGHTFEHEKGLYFTVGQSWNEWVKGKIKDSNITSLRERDFLL